MVSRITIQMACGCDDAQAQPMDIVVDTVGGSMMWDGLGNNPGRRYVWQCQTCDHVVCLNLNLLDDDEE